MANGLSLTVFDPAVTVRAALRALVAVFFAVVVVLNRPAPAVAQQPPPTGNCSTCHGYCPHVGIGSCEYGDGFGGNTCADEPFKHDDHKHCFCGLGGGVCSESMADAQQAAVEGDALDAVAKGGTLSADGLFYLAFRGERRFLRRKCDGALVGEIDLPGKSFRRLWAG